MRGIHITGFFHPSVSYQENLIPYGQKLLGSKVYIITSTLRPSFDNGMDFSPGVRKKHVPILRVAPFGVFKSLPLFFVSYRLVKRLRPEFIFLHDVSLATFQFLLLKKIGLLSNVNLVFDCHSEVGKDSVKLSSRILHKIVKGLWQVFEREVKWFYGVAPECVQFLTEVYGIDSVKCKLLPLPSIYNVKSADVRLEIREKYGVSNDKFILIHSGKLPGDKRSELVFEAFQQLDPTKFELLVCGSMEPEFRERWCEFFHLTNVKNLGWQDPNDLRDLISCADLLVQPGSLSNTFLDARCGGTPLVLRDCPQGRLLVSGGNGVTCSDMADARELCDKILECYSNNQNFSANAKALASVYDYRTIAKNLNADLVS